MKLHNILIPILVAGLTASIVLWLKRVPSTDKDVNVGEKCEVYAELACDTRDRYNWEDQRVQCQSLPGSVVTDLNYWWVKVDGCEPGVCRHNRCEGK
jgi:hypothetical protein